MAAAAQTQPAAHPLKIFRALHGLGQEELARRAGVDRDTVLKTETWHTVPSDRTLRRFAAVLGVDPSDLVLLDDERHPGQDGAVKEAPGARDRSPA